MCIHKRGSCKLVVIRLSDHQKNKILEEFEMKSTVRITALLLSLLLMAGLMAGCGAASGSKASSASGASQPAASSKTASGAASSSGKESKDAIKIGFFAPLTGNNMQYGVSFQNAISMKVDELNAAGGIGGRQIKIVAYDDKGDAKEAVNIANKIVADKDIKVAIGSFTSSCSMAAAPVFDAAGVLHLGPTASHPDFVGMGDKVFTIAATMKSEAAADADYTYKKTGGKDLAIIYLNSDYGVSHSSILKERYEKDGGKVVAYEQFIPGQTKDFTPTITKIKQTNPGALFVIADYSDGANIFKQAQKLELKCDLIGPGMLIKEEFINVVGNAAEGLLMLSTLPIYSEADRSNKDPNKAKFVSQYKDKFGTIPDGFPANAYDCITLITNMIGKVGYDADKLAEQFRQVGRYEGVSGNITIDPKTKEVTRDLMVYTIKDGKYVMDEVVAAK